MEEHLVEIACANCGITIDWTPVWIEDRPYCCIGCALGGPCICSYDEEQRGGTVRVNMRMVMAIMQDDDAERFLDLMARQGLRATKISSTGGFLRRGNSTILIGVDANGVRRVLDIIQTVCQTREPSTSAVAGSTVKRVTVPAVNPAALVIGRANVFVWDVEQYIRV